MAKRKKRGKTGPSISVGGNVEGSLIIGNHNIQVESTGPGSTVIISSGQVFSYEQQTTLARWGTSEELASLANLFQELQGQIEEKASQEIRGAAEQQASEIKKQATNEKPDVSALARARGWFVEHLPDLLGTVTGILMHPLVGKLVEAAGEVTLAQFRQNLGLPAKD